MKQTHKDRQRKYRGPKNHWRFTMSLVLCFAFSVTPQKAFAQDCEDPFSYSAIAGGVIVASGIALAAQYAGLIGLSLAALLSLQSPVSNRLDAMDDNILGRMDEFWADWLEAWKDMAKQIHSMNIEQSRQIGSMYDASTIVDATKRTMSRTEFEAKKQFQPTEDGCRFDTAARYLGTAARYGKAFEEATANEVNQIGNNAGGTAAVNGQASLEGDRWSKYLQFFCDPDNYGGSTGCTVAGTLPNGNIDVSQTLFANKTIDMEDEPTREAVRDLILNITTYEVPESLNVRGLDRPQFIEQRQTNREYMAQMDAVGSLAWGIVSERSPGIEAPEIQERRQSLGFVDAAEKPSEYEIMESVKEGLWNPKYYTDLFDTAPTATQKEIYLQAYNVMLMYKLLEKTEQIANVYAIEVGNLLDQYDKSRDGGSRYKRQ